MPTETYPLSAFPSAACAAAKFHTEIKANATIGTKLVGVRVDGQVVVEVGGTWAPPGDKVILDGIVAAHDGVPAPLARVLATVRIVQETAHAVTAVAPVWSDVGYQPSKLDDLAANLAKTLGALTARFKTNGAGCKLRIVERDADGANEVVLNGGVTLPNLAGATKAINAKFVLDQGTVPRAGTNLYVLQAQKAGALDTFEIDRAVLGVAEFL